MKPSTYIWYALYLLPLIAMFVIWWLGRIKPHLFARVSTVVEFVMAKRTTRIAVVTVWWWLGWHFFSD